MPQDALHMISQGALGGKGGFLTGLRHLILQEKYVHCTIQMLEYFKDGSPLQAFSFFLSCSHLLSEHLCHQLLGLYMAVSSTVLS
jgi:thiamine transporter ThiT